MENDDEDVLEFGRRRKEAGEMTTDDDDEDDCVDGWMEKERKRHF